MSGYDRASLLRVRARLGGMVLALLLAGRALGAGQGVGFLAAAASREGMGPENRAAWDLAGQSGARLVLVPSDGRFTDEQGHDLAIERFAVLWYHEGDSAAETAVHGARSFPILRQYVSNGGGLFLSGAGLSLVHTMGVEPVKPRRLGGGSDRYVAQFVPVRTEHPIFRGLSGGRLDSSLIATTDGGYPAFSDFHGSGGPSTGMVLARANSAQENPIVEYQFGQGRIVVMGWRLAHYSLAGNAHRANLERLTSNIIGYLADGKQWQKIEIAAPPRSAAKAGVSPEQWQALEAAIADLAATFPGRYARAEEYVGRLGSLRKTYDQIAGRMKDGVDGEGLAEVAQQFKQLQREALLDNPLMKFDRLLVIERAAGNLGLPANWESNSSLSTSGFDNRLCTFSPAGAEGELTTLYQPPAGRFVGDVDLHFDGERVLFSMPGANGRWQIHELNIASPGSAPHEIETIHEPDVDNYDACYLPDGRIIFSSTAPLVGVPCVYGSSHVTNLYLLNRDRSIRQVTVDQEHNWCPTVLNDGRVLYLRWEYADLPHSNSRRLFSMNPDGTGQMAYMSSSSYFPNSFFYARPIPGHASKVVGIATGHHGNARAGRLLIVDPARGQQEARPVVQEIPPAGGAVQAIIRDQLADGVWPQFLHPYPLSEKYFLVSAKLTPASLWGIYLADVFGNMLLLKESPGHALLEPIPVQKTAVPPRIGDRIDPGRRDAVVYMADVYQGGGLRGVPRGTVKKLRVFTYHFSYRGMGGLLGAIGMDGPWDIKRVLGTVPVEPDGSANFRVPANTPISVQPLDAEGKALQLMRSWFTAMPGESVSCIGCHEDRNAAPISRQSLAARREPSAIEPWFGPTRGFAFHREVQPVLEAYCVRCHDGQPRPDGGHIADLRGGQMIRDWKSDISGHVDPAVGGKFSVAYAELHRFVRRPGIESDMHLLSPMEFHADTTELVQLLRKGHYGVNLDGESWERLITWIDLNAPYHGTWCEIAGEAAVKPMAARKRELLRRYAGVDDDPEAIVPESRAVTISPKASLAPSAEPAPLRPEAAQGTSAPVGREVLTIRLTDNINMELMRIPAGDFSMGSADGCADERPAQRITIDRPFWIAKFEVTNEQFGAFDPNHDSHVETMHGYQFGIHGYPVNGPRQPVVRVSWNQAMDFCRWLSQKTGRKVTLPSEAQWEYACRAGTSTAYSFGGRDADFSKHANLGDARLREFALDTYINVRVVPNPNRYDDWVPKDDRFNDGGLVSTEVGGYLPNAWGLYDMHGNVWEWTRSPDRPYPYPDEAAPQGRRVVRGGSWYDRPMRCTSSFRLAYEPYQPVFNVGFRVIVEE